MQTATIFVNTKISASKQNVDITLICITYLHENKLV